MVELSWTCYDNEYFIGAEPHKVRKSPNLGQVLGQSKLVRFKSEIALFSLSAPFSYQAAGV